MAVNEVIMIDQDISDALQGQEQRVKRGFHRDEARAVLRVMQKRDYPLLDSIVKCANDANVKDLSFGRLALSIPEDHYAVLTLIYPDLKSPDAQIKTKAWKAFCFSDESTPYKPNAKLRKM